MKLRVILWLAVILVFCSGCQNSKTGTGEAVGKNDDSQQATPGEDNVVSQLGLPSDYFPTEIGTTWVYDIEIKPNKEKPPLMHEITKWSMPGSDLARVVETRGILYSRDEAVNPQLILKIKREAVKQGPKWYPEGYEIEVIKDDLGIFRYNVGVYWAITRSTRYSAEQIVMHDPNSPGSLSSSEWGSYGQEGYSHRILLFGERPGIGIGLSKENDSLIFQGPEKFGGMNCLRFTRQVDENKQNTEQGVASHLDQAFTEEMWYAKGIGLVRLIQTVDNTVTMVWKLRR